MMSPNLAYPKRKTVNQTINSLSFSSWLNIKSIYSPDLNTCHSLWEQIPYPSTCMSVTVDIAKSNGQESNGSVWNVR